MDIDIMIETEQNSSPAGRSAVASLLHPRSEDTEVRLAATAGALSLPSTDDRMPANVRALLGTILLTALLMAVIVIAIGL